MTNMLLVLSLLGCEMVLGVPDDLGGGGDRTDESWDDSDSVDTDADGLSDAEELEAGTDPTRPDTDGDGLSDGDEIARGTDPTNPDSDGDGLPDGAEIDWGTDPLLADSDSDGVSDGDEVNGQPSSDPTKADTDGDGLNDGIERTLGTDPNLVDTDGDGLSDSEEISGTIVTDPRDPDTDGDGINDGDEAAYGGDPTDPDTDNDGLDDGEEVTAGTDLTLADTDGDGLTDGEEVFTTLTDPTLADSDGGGVKDGDELINGTDPLDGTDDFHVNQPPVVTLPGVVRIISGETVVLDGSASYDPDGDPITWKWTQTDSETPISLDPTATSQSFTAPDVAVELEFLVEVSDGSLTTSYTVLVEVFPADNALDVFTHRALYGLADGAVHAAVGEGFAVVTGGGHTTGALIDLSDPSTPIVTADLGVADATVVGISGNYAYVVSSKFAGFQFKNNVHLFDVTDLDNPLALGSIPMPIAVSNTALAATALPDGNLALGTYQGLLFLGPSTTGPVLLSSNTELINVRELAASEHLVTLVGNMSQGNSIRVIDASNPAAPLVHQTVNAPGFDPNFAMWKNGTSVYLAACIGQEVVYRYDVTTKGTVDQLSGNISGGCNDLAYHDGQLLLFRTTGPTEVMTDIEGTPLLKHTLAPRGARIAGVHDGVLFTVNPQFSGVKIDRARSRFYGGEVPQPVPLLSATMVGVGSWLYTSNWGQEISVVDASTPAAPFLYNQQVVVGSGDGVASLTANGGQLAAAYFNSVEVFEGANTGTLTSWASWTPTGMVPFKLQLTDSRLYVADAGTKTVHVLELAQGPLQASNSVSTEKMNNMAGTDHVLMIDPTPNTQEALAWDVSDPTSAQALGNVNIPNSGELPVFYQEVLYTAAHGVGAVDFTDPLAPEPLNGLATVSTDRALAIDATGHLAVGSSSREIRQADVSDPYEPHVAGGFNTINAPLALTFTDKAIWYRDSGSTVRSTPRLKPGTVVLTGGDVEAGGTATFKATLTMPDGGEADGTVCTVAGGTCEITSVVGSTGDITAEFEWELPRSVGDANVQILSGSGDFYVAADLTLSVPLQK